MIALLRGSVVALTADNVVIDVGGVGYLVQASARTLALLGNVGNAVSVHTELQVREDAMTLFGFATSGERDWFRLLTSVQGIGGRVALAVLSALSAEELQTAILKADKTMITRANGVGPKLALRVINELKDKVGALPAVAGVSTTVVAGDYAEDAVSALLNLGFRQAEATAAVAAASDELGGGASLDALVRLALKKSARKS